MAEIVSFGEWVQARRNHLGASRTVMARQVGCAPITIKKIERDERRPSVQIAELLAEHLEIPEQHKKAFIKMARGEYVERMVQPSDLDGARDGIPTPKKPDRFKVLSRLEALPDQKLFGIDEVRKRVLEAASQPDRPWLISIEGLGGIGKTSLANEIVHHFLDTGRFADIGWVSAKQEEYVTGRGVQPMATASAALNVDALVDLLLAQLSDGPYPISSQDAKRAALLELVKEKPCLIVIDNLETAEDYLTLLPLLRMLARPSKFLITSRMSLQNETDVFSQSLRELSEADALAFLRYEAGLQQVKPLITADDNDLRMIYGAVGGNPLALKLVIGQAHLLPLDFILKNLEQAKESQVDQLYAYIYWQAWQTLDKSGRQLLLSLPLVPNGTLEQLRLASKLDVFELQEALSSLRQLSLIEVGGELSEPRYRLHRLTETFLMNEVIHWQTAEEMGITSSSEEGLYFHERVQFMVEHWQQEEALLKSEIETLDREKEGILKVLHLGLGVEAYWPIIKPLIFSLTGYMERRGHWQTWQKTLETAIEMAQKVDDLDGEIALLGPLGRTLQRQKLTDQVIQNYRHVIRLARQTKNLEEEARACSNLGFALIEKEQFWRSEVYSCHALKIFESLEHQHGLAHTNNHLGLLYLKSKEWEKAELHIKIARDIWEDQKDLHGLQYALGNLGYLHNEMGQPEKAIEFLEKSFQLAEDIGDQTTLANGLLDLSIAHEKVSHFEQSLLLAKRAEAIFETQGNLMNLSHAWEIIGQIHRQTGQLEIAQDYYESALEGYEGLQNTVGQIQVESRKLSLFVNQRQWKLADEIAGKIRKLTAENPGVKKNNMMTDALNEYERLNQNRI